MSSEMPALEKEYAIVTKLYTIARDFDVVIPPEELALYQTLAPSFQHLKVREPPDRKPKPLHAKLFFYNHKNLLAFCIIFTRGQFWPSGIVVACVCVCVSVCLYVCQSLACPRDNSGPVQARIAKFGPKMQKTLVKVPIVLGGNWPWPSRSNLTSKSEFTQFWTCPDHNWLPIQDRITKFGPEVENSLVKVPIVLGGNWPRPSR